MRRPAQGETLRPLQLTLTDALGWTTELALYVLPRAIDSLAMILRDRKIFSGFRHGEVALFSASMAVMMYSYEVGQLEDWREASCADLVVERRTHGSVCSFARDLQHEKETVSPFLYSTMRRFLQTSTDKMEQHLAMLEHQRQQQAKKQEQAP